MFEDIETYVEDALLMFVNDPADSDYQKGYQAALDDVLEQMQVIRNVTFPLTT